MMKVGARSDVSDRPVYWIKSPAWDLVWVLNALWLSPLVLLLARSHDDVRATRRARP